MAWDNIISRGIWVFIQPSNFLFIMLFISCIIYKYNNKNSHLTKYARRMISTCLTIFFLIGFTNLSDWLYYPFEKQFDQYRNQTDKGPYSGIIVLAGSEDTSISTITLQATLNHGGGRLAAASMLAHKFKDIPIIHSGGARKLENGWSENDVAQNFFKDQGVDISRIRFDRKSYNTHTNAMETEKLIKETENYKWFLVTSAFHMPRSVATFQKAGINFQPYPVDYKTMMDFENILSLDFSKNLFQFDLIIHEYVGVIAYYVTGRSSSLFPTIREL